jgi:hypothetical protein
VEPGNHRTLPLGGLGDFSVSLAERSGSPTDSCRHIGRGPQERGVLATAHGCSGARGRYARTLECGASKPLHLPALWILRLLGVSGDASGHGRIDQLHFAAHLSFRSQPGRGVRVGLLDGRFLAKHVPTGRTQRGSWKTDPPGCMLGTVGPDSVYLQANVSYRTHAIGLGLGVVSALVYFQRNRESIRAAEVVELEE